MIFLHLISTMFLQDVQTSEILILVYNAYGKTFHHCFFFKKYTGKPMC